MKTLIIQLARFGDILQTWPTLRALKRIEPDGELHVLGRERFKAAFAGLDAVDRLWTLDSKRIFEPLIQTSPNLDLALSEIEVWSKGLLECGFDRIINLSFSPAASFITEMIAGSSAQIAGYSRHSDGYLRIPDDASAYFYAQVGPGRANRLHLTELFAHVAGVELCENDWQGPREKDLATGSFAISPGSIVVHIGASQSGKTLSWTKWAQIVKGLALARVGEVFLIGASTEASTAEKILAACPDSEPINLVGRTQFTDLFAIIKEARLLVGGDSGPIHVASLVNTPVFNISLPSVSFWETGPRVVHSRVIRIEDEAALPSDTCVAEILNLWHEIDSAKRRQSHQEVRTRLATHVIRDRSQGFISTSVDSEPESDSFQWRMLRALYMEAPFPIAESAIFIEGIGRLIEVNQVAIAQIRALTQNSRNSTCAKILERVDEVIEQLARLVPDLGPIVRWFQTERLRLGPMPLAEVLTATERLHYRLGEVLSVYHLTSEESNLQRVGV